MIIVCARDGQPVAAHPVCCHAQPADGETWTPLELSELEGQ